ncbi:MAG: TatD family hydrolase [Bacteroidales bacterium]|nr:TatD family hydrolase [Bacteroidales bacterium]
MVDTHAHLYSGEFDSDREAVVENAIENGIKTILLPNIDSKSVKPMLDLCRRFPRTCFPMIGLHPTSVKEDYREELMETGSWLDRERFSAIGETGIDLYWDKTFQKEQEFAFRHQIRLAIDYKLPLVIHSREAHEVIINIVREFVSEGLTGVFHCFSGTHKQAQEITSMGFRLGIGGVVTYKKSGLDSVIEQTDLKHILLETDSPYLAPVPFRGRRNESAYLRHIAEKIAGIKKVSVEEVSLITTANAMEMFKLPSA